MSTRGGLAPPADLAATYPNERGPLSTAARHAAGAKARERPATLPMLGGGRSIRTSQPAVVSSTPGAAAFTLSSDFLRRALESSAGATDHRSSRHVARYTWTYSMACDMADPVRSAGTRAVGSAPALPNVAQTRRAPRRGVLGRSANARDSAMVTCRSGHIKNGALATRSALVSEHSEAKASSGSSSVDCSLLSSLVAVSERSDQR
mmetsp:Transcript_37221/g.98495  ORF Transcript_37221/g.98495 Transcript_37221/m.98495 type:complete len:206 (-) Transcript_37221:111-728(-)